MEIEKLYKWLYTSKQGSEYMTFWECSFGDKLLVISTGIMCGLVLFKYTQIAYDSWMKGKDYRESSTRKYHMALMSVFIACAITGYGYTILSIWFNPYWLRLILLIYLFWQAQKMYRQQVLNTSLEKIYKMEVELSEKYKVQAAKKTLLLDLFKDRILGEENEVSYITWDQLKDVEYDQPFDSDGREVIENTRINPDQPGFTAKSYMKANSYVPPHCHDTWKILTCLSGKFYESHTDKWYVKGTHLMIPPTDPKNKTKNYHDIKTGNEPVELLTFIMPRYEN